MLALLQRLFGPRGPIPCSRNGNTWRSQPFDA